MTNPYVKLDGYKIAPFKYTNILPYGAFANTTNAGTYPIHQKVVVHEEQLSFNWPSSEHAYHAQKILHLKSKLSPNHPAQKTLTYMLDEIQAISKAFSPRNDYDTIVNNSLLKLKQNSLNVLTKHDLDTLCEADYHKVHKPHGGRKTIDFMRTVLQLKFSQHSDLKALVIECAREGVLPIEVSQHDYNWASGPDGTGDNMLGILILQEGNKLLVAQGGQPVIPNPERAYQTLQSKSIRNVSHNQMASRLDPKNGGWSDSHSSGVAAKEVQQLSTGDPRSGRQYHYSRGSNQRLVIKDGEIVGYEYRKDERHRWQTSGTPDKFSSLVQDFHNRNTDHHQSITQAIKNYYYSSGRNQRLVIKDGAIVGYEYRKDDRHAWQTSKDPSRFTSLLKAFDALMVESIQKYYSSATSSVESGRYHLFTATSDKFPEIKGDYLKTKILAQFKERLDRSKTVEELDLEVNEIKTTEEFKILATGQGITTRLLGLKTSSEEAFNKIEEEVKDRLENQKNHGI